MRVPASARSDTITPAATTSLPLMAGILHPFSPPFPFPFPFPRREKGRLKRRREEDSPRRHGGGEESWKRRKKTDEQEADGGSRLRALFCPLPLPLPLPLPVRNNSTPAPHCTPASDQLPPLPEDPLRRQQPEQDRGQDQGMIPGVHLRRPLEHAVADRQGPGGLVALIEREETSSGSGAVLLEEAPVHRVRAGLTVGRRLHRERGAGARGLARDRGRLDPDPVLHGSGRPGR